MTRLEKLDELLDILLLHEGVSFLFLLKEIKARGLKIENQEAFIMLEKLQKDGYAVLTLDEGKINERPIIATCVITIDGKIFITKGGYVASERRRKNSNTWKTIMDVIVIATACGTLIVGAKQCTLAKQANDIQMQIDTLKTQ